MDLTLKKKEERFKYTTQFCERILRTLFQDDGFALSVAPYLSAEHFTTKIHRWTAKRIIEHVTKYGAQIDHDVIWNAATRATESGYFRGDERTALISTIKNLPRAVPNRDYVKDEVFRFVKASQYKQHILKSAEFWEQNRQSEADQELLNYLDISQDPGGLGHRYVGDLKKRLHLRKLWKPNGIPTDTKLDDYLRAGGLPKKRLGCILAPPGRGKTMCLCHFAKGAVLHGSKVLYVTMELLEEDIADRLDANFSNVNLGALTSRLDQTRTAIKNVGRKFGDPLIIKFFPPQTLTIAGLKAYLRRLEHVKKFKPDLLIVDFADYFISSKSYTDGYMELGLIYQELRGLAITENMAAWTACFTGDTLIDTPAGKVSIKSLVGKTDVPVYCFDKTKQEIIISTMRGCWLDTKAAKLVEVELDNGEKIRCTPNHPFMLRDGKYVHASRLKPGDSLMALHRASYQYGKKKLKKINVTGRWRGWRYESHVVASWKLGRKIKKGEVVHHIDGEHFNDAPENLEVVDAGEHIADHRVSFNPMWSKETRAKVSASRKGKAVGDANPMRRVENRVKFMGDNNPQKRPEVAVKTAKGVARMWAEMTPEERRKRSEAIRAGQRAARARRARRRPLPEMRLNHKVVAVRELRILEDVYNMEVDEHHNFVLGAGVVVKNSQGNRASADAKVVDMANLADSFKKAGIVDLLVGFSQIQKEKARHRARLFIAKSRLGPSDVEVQIKTNPSKQMILPA